MTIAFCIRTKFLEHRLELLQYSADEENRHYISIYENLEDRKVVGTCLSEHILDRFIHLAVLAGVRYALENIHSYIHSNLVAFSHHLGTCLKTISKNLFKLFTRFK